jgi:hypothetical protein
VRYFTNHVRRRRSRLLDDLREFEANPDLCAEDPEMQAAWLASHAVTWAFLRDFTRAHQCLERARSLQCRDGWVTSCESNVLGLEDRWREALKYAELAWEIKPRAPYAASSLSNSLLNLGCVQESARRLAAASENCQSYEVVHLACWYQCALAETLDGDSRRLALDYARKLSGRSPTLAPLADRDSRRPLARSRLDIAELADDHAEMERWAEEVRIPFYRKILANLRRNPEGRRIRLPFRRAIQKHEGCLPTSLASALATLGEHLDPDVMAAEITFGGTAEWAAAEWLEKHRLTVRFFSVARGQDGEVAEKPATDDVVIRTVQFEEERFADLESPELLLSAGLPEIDFVEPVQAGQEVEPVTIRGSDKEAHADRFAPKEDLEDWTQDLVIHLKYLPATSKHREAGKEDIVQTFDPSKHYGANQPRFQNYINLCLTNRVRTIHSKRMKDAMCHTGNLSLTGQMDSERCGEVDDEYGHSHSEVLRSAAAASEKRARHRASVKKFIDFVRQEDPSVLPAIEAILATGTHGDGDGFLGTTGARFARLRTRMRQLGKCFVNAEPVPRQRKPYKKRPKTGAAPDPVSNS